MEVGLKLHENAKALSKGRDSSAEVASGLGERCVNLVRVVTHGAALQSKADNGSSLRSTVVNHSCGKTE